MKKELFKLASILIGLVCGYVLALCFGMVDFSALSNAGWFQLPQPFAFGVKFDISAIIPLAILFLVNSIQAMGDFSATTSGGMDRLPTDQELNGGIIGYGISNIVSACFGCPPTATYSQNVGIVSTTKVISRRVLGIAAAILMAAGKTIEQAAAEFAGKGYGEFKPAVGEAVVELLRPIREKTTDLLNNKDYLEQVYKEGAQKASYLARKTLDKVYRKVGFVAR